jgi:hypothetical protein
MEVLSRNLPGVSEEELRRACNPTDILPDETPNTSVTRYGYTNLLGVCPYDRLSN